jgi:hypothetical protein
VTTIDLEKDGCHQIMDFRGLQIRDLWVLRFETIEGRSPGADNSRRYERVRMAVDLELWVNVEEGF